MHNLKCKELYMDAQEDMHMNDYSKITALYSRLSVGDEDRDGGRKQLHTEPEEVFGKLRQTAKIDEYPALH